MKSFAAAAIVAAALLPAALPQEAAAQEIEWRLDHRNQPSILAAVKAERIFITASDEHEGNATGVLADLAFGLPVNEEGGELFLGLRVGAEEGGETRLVAPHLFYRSYYGYEEWKTFFDAGLLLRIEPLWAAAARLGFGLQYDFHENWGAYAAAGTSIGFGQGLQVGIEGGVGVQFRFGTAG